MVFGAAAYLHSQVSDLENTSYVLQLVKFLPQDLNALSHIFLSAKTFEAEDLWGWNSLEIAADGKFHNITTDWLDHFYVVAALLALESNEFLQIDLTDQLLYHFESDIIPSVLDKLSTQPTYRLYRVSDRSIDKFKSMIVGSKKRFLEVEQDRKERIEITPDIVDDFARRLTDKYLEECELKKIFIREGVLSYTDCAEEENFKYFGYKVVVEKEDISGKRPTIVDLPSFLAIQLAEGEAEAMFRTMCDGSSKIVRAKTMEDASVMLTLFGKEYSHFPMMAIYDNTFEVGSFVENIMGFVPKYRLSGAVEKHLLGELNFERNAVPVYTVPNKGGQTARVLIFVLSEFGKWEQMERADPFVSIKDLAKDKLELNSVISGDKGFPTDNLKIRRSAVVELFNRLKFTVLKSDYALVIELPKKPS